MITFDKLLIKLPLSAVEVNTDSSEWVMTANPDGIIQRRVGNKKEKKSRYNPFAPVLPYRAGLNYIEVNYLREQVLVIVTGKILDNPAELISIENIWQVFGKINSSDLLRINTLQVKDTAQLLTADNTTDVVTTLAPAEYTRTIDCHYAGKDYIQCRDYRPNLQLQHRNKDRRTSRTLTLYDKTLESNNAPYFHPNTLRLELRLNSAEILRKYLQLPKGNIMLFDALTSPTNPIDAVFTELTRDIPLLHLTDITTAPDTLSFSARETAFYHDELTRKEKRFFADLKFNGFDLQRLRQQLKGDKNAAREIKEYSEILARWQAFSSDASQDIQLLQELIDKIKTPAIYNNLLNTIHHYAETEATAAA